MKLSKKIQRAGNIAGTTIVTAGAAITTAAIALPIATVMATGVAATIASQGIFSLAAKIRKHNNLDIHSTSTATTPGTNS